MTEITYFNSSIIILSQGHFATMFIYLNVPVVLQAVQLVSVSSLSHFKLLNCILFIYNYNYTKNNYKVGKLKFNFQKIHFHKDIY